MKELQYTKSQLEIVWREQLDNLIYKAEGYYHLAKMLGVNHSTVKGWIDRGRISKAGARLVERNIELKKNFKAKDLRPDL